MTRTIICSVAALAMLATSPAAARTRPLPSQAAIDAQIAAAMQATGARSVAVAVIDHGRVLWVKPYGVRNKDGAPLTDTSIMYGASLTKAVFGYLVLKLVDAGKIDLDTPIERYLPKPLSAYTDETMVKKYGDFSLVAADPRWHRLTPRILLNHASGFVNTTPDEPDFKLRFHFDPGTHYAYSGMGLLLLQLVIEQGIGLDVATELQRRVFDPLGMKDTSLTWREDFQGRAASGWSLDGEAPGHARQSRVRVAGSMDTTITDMARFAAAMVSGMGLLPRSRRELTRPQLAITSASEFPTLQPEAPPAKRVKGLAVGTAVLTYAGPQGRVFEKGGHNDLTGNTILCVERGQRCVVILGADVRFEAAFPAITRFILGDTGFPWAWVYGDMKFWRPDVSTQG
ncbi:serine hydrolase domain-containing protein [uncultured Sphingomonas sp.]|uniref:serine hydrolase domain-containing protein n=1 Tax=uncultured Sphingomonas sp. TaxID=158754 RepID=UPI0035CAE805